MRNTLNFYLIARSQMLTLSSLTAVYQWRGGLELQPPLRSFYSSGRALLTSRVTHTHTRLDSEASHLSSAAKEKIK